MKKCSKCKQVKTLSEFYKDKSKLDGHRPDCNKCFKIQNDKYRLENKQKISNQKKIYHITKKKQIALTHKNYYIKNKEKILKQNTKYVRNKRRNDIRFKLKSNLRTRVSKALLSNRKSLSTMFLIGCEIDYLMYHLQSNFQPGMSWDNYGDWHIDHIKPCALFDLSKKSEQRECFHYTNLQPLWAEDNQSKGNKYV